MFMFVGPRLLSRSSTAARSSCTSARPPARASRPPSASSRRSRTRSARSSRRTSATLIVDNIGLPARAYNLAFTDGSTIGVNDGVILVVAEGRPRADRRLRAQAARGAAGRISRSDVLFPGRRHRDADPQFRPAGADRRAHRRLRPRDQPARRQGAAAAHRRHPRHRRRPSAAGGRRPGVLRHDRPRPGGAARPQRQHHRHQHQCQPELVRAGHAQFLDRPDSREFPITSRSRRRSTTSAR